MAASGSKRKDVEHIHPSSEDGGLDHIPSSDDDSVGTSLSVGPLAPSPILEPYQGTYQQLYSMPLSSSRLLPTETEAVSPVGSHEDGDDGDDERTPRRRARRGARFYDPAETAAIFAKALTSNSGRGAVDTETLIDFLPSLTHEQVMELRIEYKLIVKTGPERKGVNIAKHIRARLGDEKLDFKNPDFMKACYATALGRWESEAYWASSWYHTDKARRELLIESLMGRSNDEIRCIEDGFKDPKYSHSLSKSIRTELKEDKFKKAVLMVLEKQRMEETEDIDDELVNNDVKQLHDAVCSKNGGETLMITIITLRSDKHLRKVLRVYKDTFDGANFAKDALTKCGNLVVCSPPSFPVSKQS
jgi:hypothetical protein